MYVCMHACMHACMSVWMYKDRCCTIYIVLYIQGFGLVSRLDDGL